MYGEEGAPQSTSYGSPAAPENVANAPSMEKLGTDANRVQIKNVEMPEEMQEHAVATAIRASEMESSPRLMAGIVKKEFDRRYGPLWHCVVGKTYGCSISHESGAFIFFYVGPWAFMLFKTC